VEHVAKKSVTIRFRLFNFRQTGHQLSDTLTGICMDIRNDKMAHDWMIACVHDSKSVSVKLEILRDGTVAISLMGFHLMTIGEQYTS
jgi:hypothetical protein